MEALTAIDEAIGKRRSFFSDPQDIQREFEQQLREVDGAVQGGTEIDNAVRTWYALASRDNNIGKRETRVWALYIHLGKQTTGQVIADHQFKKCIQVLGNTPLYLLAHLLDGFYRKLYTFEFVRRMLEYMRNYSDVCFIEDQQCWGAQKQTDVTSIEKCMKIIKTASKSSHFLADTADVALETLVEFAIIFVARDMMAMQPRRNTGPAVILTVRRLVDIIRRKQSTVDHIFNDDTGIAKTLFDRIAENNNYPPDLSSMGKLAHFFLTFVKPIDVSAFDLEGLGPAVQYFDNYFDGVKGTSADDDMLDQHMLEFAERGWKPRKLYSYDSGAGARTTRAAARGAKAGWQSAPVKAVRKGVGMALKTVLWGGPEGMQAGITAIVDELKAELLKVRTVSRNKNDPYTYRYIKVRALRNMRKHVESLLKVRESDKGTVRERCVTLHNSRRHLFTLNTWKQLMPDVEDFVMSGDNEKKLKEIVIHKKCELYALYEVGDALHKAVDVANSLQKRIKNLARNGGDEELFSIFDEFDRLVWIQQKCWQEHAHDDFYDEKWVTEGGAEGKPFFPWFIERKSLFLKDKTRLASDYNTSLAQLLRNIEYGDAEDDYYATLDKKGTHGKEDPGALQQLQILDEQACPVPLPGSDGGEGALALATTAAAPSLFTGMSQEAVRSLFMTLETEAERLGAAAQAVATGGPVQHPPYVMTGGAEGEEPSNSQQAVEVGGSNLQPLINSQRERVNRLSQAANSAVLGAVNAAKLLAGHEKAVLQAYLMEPMLKVGDAFYSRVRKEPFHYQTPFGFKKGTDDIFKVQAVDTAKLFNAVNKPMVQRVTILTLLMWALTEIDIVLLYALKILRIGTFSIAIYASNKIFVERYVSQVFTDKKAAPSLFKVMLLAMSIDAFLQLVLTMVLVMSSVMLKKKESDTFAIDDGFIFLSLKEYILSSALVLVIGLIVSRVMMTKRYFNYRNDGLRVVNGFSEIMLGVFFAVSLLPCSKLMLA